MDQRGTESGCSVLEEVASLATGPEPAAFTCEPISFRLVQRPVVEAPAAAPQEAVPPAAAPEVVVEREPVEREPAPAPYYAADDDEQDDGNEVEDDDEGRGGIVRRAPRVDPRLTDPDTLERAKRVEVYRAMIEQDPKVSIFGRTNSPPRRVLPAPKTL